MTRSEAEIKLKRIFGLDHFYDEQWRSIERILRGERILMIERTGFGKSLCYQFPATQFDGITVVFSPLIALMRDQVRSLCERGIPAAYINSEQSYEENQNSIQRALNGEIKILYIAPERQENEEWVEATRQLKLSMVVVDEAHTISTWGHDFRPSFRRIINLVQLLPQSLPVLATTATATKKVQYDIEQQIGGRLTTIRGNLIRPNFQLQVVKVQSEDEKMIWLAENLNAINGTGLIYTGTRIDTEVYANWLRFVGINATDYNAGFDADTRKSIEQDLMQNKWKCIVSTNALGMGIDKSDIRFVIHTQMPASPIHYYQEIGRAGRDGKPTRIILFYNEKKENGNDVATDSLLPLSFVEGSRPTTNKYQKVISLLQEEPLSEREVLKKANLKTNQLRVIKADLIDQGIIKEVLYGKIKKYEYQYNAPALNTDSFEALRDAKLKDLHAMEEYIYTDMPRMKYLCSFLDSDETVEYSNCDNTNLERITVSVTPEWMTKLEDFRETYFPSLELSSWTIRKGGFRLRYIAPDKVQVEKTVKNDMGEVIERPIIEYSNIINLLEYNQEEREIIEEHLGKASRLVDGYAASYYGVSNVGAAIHRSKYENGGDFPDFLLKKTLSVFGKKFRGIHFDLVLYLPPTNSGDLVKNFATKFARVIGVPISHELIKVRITQEQKMFQNSYSKQENVCGAFDIDEDIVKDKYIVLLDDIYDSGSTLKEVGKLLTQKGAKCIVPIVIAKTVGGTL
ncbi:MAG: RecQ family ATP-dependent DNA helicase [Bacteroidales bacterium]|nr:RecQ family ATP-dependent DNA helicase [Bacteroidales bacterium]